VILRSTGRRIVATREQLRAKTVPAVARLARSKDFRSAFATAGERQRAIISVLPDDVATGLEVVGSPTASAFLLRRDLWSRWTSWWDGNGYTSGGRRQFIERFGSSCTEVLDMKALNPGKRHGERGYYGLRLRAVGDTGAGVDDDEASNW